MHLRIPLTAFRLPDVCEESLAEIEEIMEAQSSEIITQTFLSWKMSRKKYIL